jgi:hypothetical protein
MGMRAVGRTSLPTSLESLVVHDAAPTEGSYRCALKARTVSDMRSVSDAVIRAADGRIVCEVRGIEMHMVDTGSKD